MNKIEKKTGTLSLLSISFEQNNNTYDSKQKNIILKKLDTINKKIRKTFKQLQATTTKTFINLNFNHTHLIEDSYSNQQTNNLLNSKPIRGSSYAEKQKNSSQKNSSIPKLCRDYLKYFYKMEIKLNSNKLQNSEIEIASDKKIKNFENENKCIVIPEKKSSLVIKSKTIHSSTQSSLSSLKNIPVTKNNMQLQDNKNNYLLLHTKSIHNRNEKRSIPETVLENNKIEKNSMNDSLMNSEDKNIKLNRSPNNVNKTEESKDNKSFNQKVFNTKNIENNIFASPGGLALVLFILYATFAF
ncbi:hypothetical protein PIROE2DRAFT_3050 [Piromyces sp. E2]|nr:hypothetical protein PIROE2DRAFT_3050 [Piromyces sp. E2]|eukprot:OUM69154.1 hypothetical protein PIROE2DRAFT_3050 [Piromyces sp. E2]